MERTLRAWIGAIAALTLAACAHAPTRPAERTTADIGIPVPPNASTWFRGHYTERVLLFHDTYTTPMNGGVAFVGDSITEGGDWTAAFPGAATRNYGVSGDTTIGLELRLSQVVAARPAKIFLLVGTNDLGNYNTPPAEIVANYARLLDSLAASLPRTRIYMQTVLPREAENAEGVRAINTGLRALADARRLTLIDIYTPFAVADGRLDPAVTQDNLHLNPIGYSRWQSILAPYVTAS